MVKGSSAGVLIIMGLMCVFGGIMWDSSVGYAWQDLNNNTTAGTTEHAATSSGQIFGYGFGMFITIFGVLLMVGAVLVLIAGASGGR
jgi:hypothetical protein